MFILVIFQGHDNPTFLLYSGVSSTFLSHLLSIREISLLIDLKMYCYHLPQVF